MGKNPQTGDGVEHGCLPSDHNLYGPAPLPGHTELANL
jgi:hypothetical protein